MPAKVKAFSNVVEGPMGFHMPEETARAIEAATKGLPADFTYRRRAKSTANFQLVPGERADVSYITTDAPDRDGEVMVTKGLSFAGYNKVVTWCHSYGPADGYDGMPVGTCEWFKVGKTGDASNGVIAKTAYHTRPDDWQGPWMPDAIVHLQKQNPPACTGKSIGFIPMHMREASRGELADRPEWAGKVLIDKAVVFEYAVAPVPCNPEAEVIAIAKGAIDPAAKALIARAMRELGVKGVADIAADAMNEAAQNVAEMIPYLTSDELRYALMRRLREGFNDEDRQAIQQAVIDVFDRAAGAV